jgi:hypothetical protein
LLFCFLLFPSAGGPSLISLDWRQQTSSKTQRQFEVEQKGQNLRVKTVATNSDGTSRLEPKYFTEESTGLPGRTPFAGAGRLGNREQSIRTVGVFVSFENSLLGVASEIKWLDLAPVPVLERIVVLLSRMSNCRIVGGKSDVLGAIQQREKNTQTGWRRTQSCANFSPAGNSLLTGKNTGNFAASAYPR